MGTSDGITYLSLGTNIGDKSANLRHACQLIQMQVGNILCQSSVYETQPWGFQSRNMFLNMCLKVKTSLSPFELLEVTQDIERMMGRQSKSNGTYSDRIIDIDILLYDDLEIHTERLTIPHPLMFQRDFVMLPLYEIGFNNTQ